MNPGTTDPAVTNQTLDHPTAPAPGSPVAERTHNSSSGAPGTPTGNVTTENGPVNPAAVPPAGPTNAQVIVPKVTATLVSVTDVTPVLTAYAAVDLENSHVVWDTPVALEPALLQAGYGLSMARDNATGVLHLSYLEFSNSSETPGMLVYQNGTGTHWNKPVIVDDSIGFYHRDVPESIRHTSIALGPDGLPHIAYMSWSNGYHLKYARMLRACERTWTPGGDIPDRQFPGEDPGNRTWYTGAERVNSGWLVSSATTPGGLAGWGASLAVDSNNELRFSYLGQKGYSSPVMLMYGTYNASIFQQVNMKSAMFTFVPNPVTGLYGSLPFVYWPEHTRAGIQTSIALDTAGR